MEEFRSEGEEITHTLIQELRRIRSRKELINSAGKLQRLFNNMADLMIAANEFRQKNPHTAKDLPSCNNELNSRLRSELNRIYKIEGCRQIMEKYEEQALHRLDAYEKKLKRVAL